MKKMLLLLVCFLCLAIPTYAQETIDLQDYTTCDEFGSCRIEVDINELSLSKDGKDMLKAIKHDTPYELNSSAEIHNFNVEIQEEKLIITGKVTEDTYFLLGVEDVLIDPWFNTTYPHCFELIVQNGVANFVAPFNITWNANISANFSGIRVVNASCNETASDLPFYTPKIVNGSWARVDVRLDGSQNISFYSNATEGYNYSDVTATWGDGLILYTTGDEGTGTTLEDNTILNSKTHGTIDARGYVDGVFWGFEAVDYERADTDYTTFGDNNDVSTAVTLMAWVKIESVSSTNEYMAWSKGSSGSSGSYQLGVYGNGSALCNLKIGSWGSAIKSSATVDDGLWHLIGCTYDGTDKVLYVDGSIENQETDVGSIDNSADSLLQGAFLPATHNFDGVIDEAKIWNRTLNYTEMAWYYAETVPNITMGDYVPLPTNATPPANVTDIFNQSYIICTSNMTLYTHDTAFINGTFNYTDEYFYCAYGCDNVTRSCSPEPFIQDLIEYGVLFAFAMVILFIGIKISKKKRRRR